MEKQLDLRGDTIRVVDVVAGSGGVLVDTLRTSAINPSVPLTDVSMNTNLKVSSIVGMDALTPVEINADLEVTGDIQIDGALTLSTFPDSWTSLKSGFTSYASDTYYTVAGTSLTVSGGSGYINGKVITWIEQTMTNVLTTAYDTCCYIGVDANGDMIVQTYLSTTWYQNQIALLKFYTDTNNNLFIIPDNQPATIDLSLGKLLSDQIGTWISNAGVISSPGTDRMKYTLNATIYDMRLSRVCSHGSFGEETFMIYFKNHTGAIHCVSGGTTHLTYQYSMGYASPTDADDGKYLLHTVYLAIGTGHALNYESRIRPVVLLSTYQYDYRQQCLNDISVGSFTTPSTEFASLRLAKIGYVVVQRSGTDTLVCDMISDCATLNKKITHQSLGYLASGPQCDSGHTALCNIVAVALAGADATFRADSKLGTILVDTTPPAGSSALQVCVASDNISTQAWKRVLSSEDTSLVKITGTQTISGEKTFQSIIAPTLSPTGMIIEFVGINIPGGWLECNGDLVSQTTYDTLFGVIGHCFGPNLIASIATGRISFSEGYNPSYSGSSEDQIVIYSVSDTDPESTPTWATSDHFARIVGGTGDLDMTIHSTAEDQIANTNPFSISATGADLRLGSATHFYLPDLRGMFTRGSGTSSRLTASGSAFSGSQPGAYQSDQIQSHRHVNTDTGFALTSWRGSYHDANDIGIGTVEGQPYMSWSGGIGAPSADASNGTPRSGLETRPTCISVRKLIHL